MIVTIIGSLSKKEKMLEAKEHFEKFGNEVNCPLDGCLQKMPLIGIQTTWIEKIKQSDLIVAIPKNIFAEGDGLSKYVFTIGESTSYEMAIAMSYNKPVVFW